MSRARDLRWYRTGPVNRLGVYGDNFVPGVTPEWIYLEVAPEAATVRVGAGVPTP